MEVPAPTQSLSSGTKSAAFDSFNAKSSDANATWITSQEALQDAGKCLPKAPR